MHEDLWNLLAARQHVGLRRLLAPGQDEATQARIVEAGAHAPDHGSLLPWRFMLIPQGRRDDLGAMIAYGLHKIPGTAQHDLELG